MELLEDLILKQGDVRGNNILKVDGIINHQFQPQHMFEFGKEFALRFRGVKVDRILTAEVSGISIAAMTGLAMGVKYVTYARKSQPVTMTGIIHTENAPSPTKGGYITLNVSGDYLRLDENILIIDDFLASSETLKAMARIVKSAGADLVGIGIMIEKAFQNGREKFHKDFPDVPIESLAIITKMNGATITFAD